MFHRRSRLFSGRFAGALVLGVNDAIVEMLGALTGLTFALEDTRLIASAGLITGVAASLSMAASEFLAVREDKNGPPLLEALLTGGAYGLSVFLLILPYFVFPTPMVSWLWMLIMAVMIIALYNAYIYYTKKEPFLRRFLLMLAISFTVAVVSYLIGVKVNGLLQLS